VSDSPGGLPEEFADLHASLHQARTFALADMPAHFDTVLSVGANGLWYFEWFEKAYGHVPRHIGVEAYTPRPPVLPDNVEWVEADVAGPEGVAAIGSGSVDLVFSGQNIEHLWPDQVEAFLIESNRVLRTGGWLVLDSPNRDITAAYQWSMSEHTIELTPDEAQVFLTLAGFEVETVKGLWLCRQDGNLLDLGPKGTAEGTAEVLERMMLASTRPADSFIWWVEARKVGDPDIPALGRAIRSVFAANWEERVNRIEPKEGVPVTLADGRSGVRMEKDRWGCIMLGPSMALRPGKYTFEMEVNWSGFGGGDGTVAQMDVVAYDQVLEIVDLVAHSPSGRETVTCTVNLSELQFAVHARLFSTGPAQIETPLTITLSPDPYGSSVPDGS
jgi:SAM-dependent methyltransferase